MTTSRPSRRTNSSRRLNWFLALILANPSWGDVDVRPIVSPTVDQMRNVELLSPKGKDALTPEESARAFRHADRGDRVRNAPRRLAANARPKALNQLPSMHRIYAERSDDDKRPVGSRSSRRADVLYYDYGSDEIVHEVVNLDNGRIEETRVERGADKQPPITSAETLAAVQLVLDHPKLGPRLRRLYLDASGQALTNAAQLQAHGGIFLPDSAQGTPLETVTVSCRRHRCLHFLLPYGDTSVIDPGNLVVDLSAGQVLWVDQNARSHADSGLSEPGDASDPR